MTPTKFPAGLKLEKSKIQKKRSKIIQGNIRKFFFQFYKNTYNFSRTHSQEHLICIIASLDAFEYTTYH